MSVLLTHAQEPYVTIFFMNFFQFLFQDFDHNRQNTKGKIVAFTFRLANICSRKKGYKIFLFPFLIYYKIVYEWVFGFEVPYNTTIGKGFRVYHIQSIVINKDTVIGENFTLRQSVTIGNSKADGKSPVIGNNVEIGAHTIIIGDITIGDNTIIGAGSVVTKSIPANSIAYGNPLTIKSKV